MLKAGALLYAVVIALLMAIISSSLILFAYYNRLSVDTLLLKEKLNMNAESGVNLLVSSPGLDKTAVFEPYDLYGNGTDSVLLKTITWGMYKVAVSKAFSGRHASTACALYGEAVLSDTHNYALYLADGGDQLAVTGLTVLKGDCFVPSGTIKRGYIEGQSFSGAKTSEGRVLPSMKRLPALNSEVIAKNRSYFPAQFVSSTEPLSADSILEMDTIYNSFENEPLIIYNPGQLKNRTVKGNVIIISDKPVFIEAGSSLDQVLIYAPEIRIGEGFTGSFQAFATKKIIVDENVRLEYPSSLSVFTEQKSDSAASLLIADNCKIEGCLTLISEGKMRDKISLGKNSSMYGQVYCQGYFELKGNVYGQVLCDKFILKTPSSVYENNLIGCTIDISMLPQDFAGSMLMQRKERKLAERIHPQ